MKDKLDLIISIGRGDWEEVSLWCQKLQISDNGALDGYHEAFKWANNLMID